MSTVLETYQSQPIKSCHTNPHQFKFSPAANWIPLSHLLTSQTQAVSLEISKTSRNFLKKFSSKVLKFAPLVSSGALRSCLTSKTTAYVKNYISILVLKTLELNPGPLEMTCANQDGQVPSSLSVDSNPGPQKMPYTNQDRKRPANLFNHRLELLNYSATHQIVKGDSPNGHQITASLVPLRTQTYAEVVACLKRLRQGVRIDNFLPIETQAQGQDLNPDPESLRLPALRTKGLPACIFLGLSPCKLKPRMMAQMVKQAKPKE
ncbi:hypothetical protein DSO57_1034667 [Entomophthora muscae]|uniref:Uncharacterized protein n=1 Tax=Entomophthora muscae TaxID=34485 RepID=A0ACC2TAL2_9FUNG|nr:hypothetical protein DSO57_1034667 [Entomophthora muscae]